MNEHDFVRSIHNALPRDLYRWKINDNFQGGVADAYYSGPAGDLWVEYKYVKLPKRPETRLPDRYGLSPQQLAWLTERHKEGRSVALVVGSDRGNLLLTDPDLFNKPCTMWGFEQNAIDKKGIIAHILSKTQIKQ